MAIDLVCDTPVTSYVQVDWAELASSDLAVSTSTKRSKNIGGTTCLYFLPVGPIEVLLSISALMREVSLIVFFGDWEHSLYHLEVYAHCAWWGGQGTGVYPSVGKVDESQEVTVWNISVLGQQEFSIIKLRFVFMLSQLGSCGETEGIEETVNDLFLFVGHGWIIVLPIKYESESGGPD